MRAGSHQRDRGEHSDAIFFLNYCGLEVRSFFRYGRAQGIPRPAEDKIDYKEARRELSLSLSSSFSPIISLFQRHSRLFEKRVDFQAREGESASEKEQDKVGLGVGLSTRRGQEEEEEEEEKRGRETCRYRDVTPAFFTGTPLTSHYEHLSGSSSPQSRRRPLSYFLSIFPIFHPLTRALSLSRSPSFSSYPLPLREIS